MATRKQRASGSSAGRLTEDLIGYSLPIDQPLYTRLPVYYKNTTILMYTYETDRDAALDVLPEQLQLPEGPARVRMIFANYEFSSIGFYNEVAQAIACTYLPKTGGRASVQSKERSFNYPVRLHVTSDRAMAAGREIGGFPKKIGTIGFRKGAEYISWLESPDGLRICSGVLTPGFSLPDQVPRKIDYASLRVIPNYEALQVGKPLPPPSIRQLLETSWELSSGEMWSATGSVHLTGASDLDPYHKLPVRQLVACSLFIGEMNISRVALLEDF